MHECEEVVLPNKVIGLFRDIMLLLEVYLNKLIKNN